MGRLVKMFAIIFTVLMMSTVCFGKMRYECSRYENGEWKGYVEVLADSKGEAEQLAIIKYRDELKYKFDRIECK